MTDRPALTTLQALRRMFEYIPARRRWQGIVILGMMLVGAAAELLTIGAVLPFLALIADPGAASKYTKLAWLLSVLGVQGRSESIADVAAVFCVIAVAAAAIRIFLAWLTQKFVFRLGYDLGVALYERMLYQPYSFHVSQNSTRIISAINKVQQVVNGMMMPLMQGLTSIVIALAIFGGLLFVNAPAALGSALGFGLIYLLVSLVTRSRLTRNGQIIAQASTVRIQTVREGLGGIRDVLIDHVQPIYVKKFARVDTALRDAQATNALIAAAPRFVVEGLGMVMIAVLALMLSGGKGGLASALPVLGALALGAQRMLPLLQLVYNGWSQLMGGRATFLDVLALLDHPLPGVAERHRVVDPLPFRHSIRLDHVDFRYGEEGPLVVRDVNLEILKGARVGFVGKTGSGKSTIMDLVMGLLSPSAGSIAIDGAVLDKGNRATWQAQIAHVPQHIYLSDATIIENIAFGVPRDQIDEERARDAARRADIADFIDEQRLGYDTIVGERGTRLSGGQRQRVGIARALYKRSTLLVFDEATSALDDATEASVIKAIERLGRDLTVLMIAHRVTTLRNCDLIYRLDRGVIVEQGDYAEIVGVDRASPARASR